MDFLESVLRWLIANIDFVVMATVVSTIVTGAFKIAELVTNRQMLRHQRDRLKPTLRVSFDRHAKIDGWIHGRLSATNFEAPRFRIIEIRARLWSSQRIALGEWTRRSFEPAEGDTGKRVLRYRSELLEAGDDLPSYIFVSDGDQQAVRLRISIKTDTPVPKRIKIRVRRRVE